MNVHHLPESEGAAEFHRLLRERIVVLDGAMGTMIQARRLEEADYRGARFADWPSPVKGNATTCW